MALNTASLFDQPEYADIVVSYSGRKTFCHKIILCTSSEYFKKLCGPGSHFAESKQDTIELKEDDPDAVYQLLRYIYTKDAHCGDRESDYALQLEISKVANKYLNLELLHIAYRKFHALFTAITNPEEIFESVTHVRSASALDETLKLADEVESRHLIPLMKVPGFRDCIDQDREMMWKLLDGFVDFKAGLKEMVLVCCTACGRHQFFHADTEWAKMTTHRGCHYDYGQGGIKRISCWVETDNIEDFLSESTKWSKLI